MYRSRPGEETGKYERISYECRISEKHNPPACRRECAFYLFCKNANDSETKLAESSCRLHGTHSVGFQEL